jgi:prepilin-type N-terminal cleavage/methylation domain-containing protein
MIAVKRQQRGFSLIELSIVLVILGLLAGGILAGQSLIRAAELRTVATEYQRYTTAIYSFRDKYFALPGDMSNATRFWTAQDSTPATCQTTASSGAATCDGNGDGQIADSTYEMFRAWQHLANAGLIEGSYTGVKSGTLNDSHALGVNAPRSKMGNGGWAISAIGTFFAGDNATYAGNYGNLLWFGKATTERPQSDILKPEEAWNIDTKMDDGKPGQGKVFMRSDSNVWGAANNCSTSTSNTDYAGEYRLNISAISCALMIRNN